MLEKKGEGKDESKKFALLEKQHQKEIQEISKEKQKNELNLKKTEDTMNKQLTFAEQRLKKLQEDLEKQKKARDDLEKSKKFDENRFFKFKQDLS